jgi:[pyruvate, water dikinase]-phosphate phosphotransferase / [pyruvate, water dikinase] kinase
MERGVFFISDRTGITVETLGGSILAQFAGVAFRKSTLRFIDTPERARAAAALIERTAGELGSRPIVLTTIIDPAVRAELARGGGLVLDLVDAFIAPLEVELGRPAAQAVGVTHGALDTGRYTLRMDAVNFALATDDGLNAVDYDRAELIVLGVSRSGKTPTCLYLALTYGIYAANYPLTEDDFERAQLPATLAGRRARLFGLSIDPRRLREIREERRPGSPYASLKQCQREVRRAEALYRAAGVPWIDTTRMSVEEIATTILQGTDLQPHTG